MRNKAEILEWEGRWFVPAGLATLAGVALVIASAFAIGAVSGDGDAELLRSAHEHSSSVNLAAALQAAGFVFLVAPLLFLFKATAARSGRVRNQLIGLVIAAPLFLSAAAVLNAVATDDAGNAFVAGTAKPGITAKVADEEATNAISEAPTHGAAIGFGLGGRLGLAFALLYTCLYAMRVGLLTRFWGSLGMALGVAALLLLVQFTMIWFIYFGLLLLGRLPGGRPPAWAAGEAVPWPTPGEKAAESLEGSEPLDPSDSGDAGPGEGGRRKRKQRD